MRKQVFMKITEDARNLIYMCHIGGGKIDATLRKLALAKLWSERRFYLVQRVEDEIYRDLEELDKRDLLFILRFYILPTCDKGQLLLRLSKRGFVNVDRLRSELGSLIKDVPEFRDELHTLTSDEDYKPIREILLGEAVEEVPSIPRRRSAREARGVEEE